MLLNPILNFKQFRQTDSVNISQKANNALNKYNLPTDKVCFTSKADILSETNIYTKNSIALLKNKKIKEESYRKLVNELGKQVVVDFSSPALVTACNFIDLMNVDDINELSKDTRKNLLKMLMKFNIGIFEPSEELKTYFPLLPEYPDEYEDLLSQIVNSLRINRAKSGKGLSEKFNETMLDLGERLSKLSKEEFADLEITQTYTKDEFIRTVLAKINGLSEKEKQKVFNYFGFELYKNELTKSGYSLNGYPVNPTETISKSEDTKMKKVIESMREDVIRFSTQKVKVSDKNTEKFINEILEFFPEMQTMIGRIQHGTHEFDVMKHSLKVMQKILQDENFKKLSNSDKRVIILASLFHDIAKKEKTNDKFHAENGSFDVYYICKKLNLTKEEENKLYKLIKNHEWLGYVNTAKSASELDKRLKSVAFDLQESNLFDMSLIFAHADLKAVTADEFFHDIPEYNADKSMRSYGEIADIYAQKIKKHIIELKKTQSLLPVTKLPKAGTIRAKVTKINSDGSTNIKGVYIDNSGLVAVKYNEVENWEDLGFPKGTTSKGIQTAVKSDLSEKITDVDTGNIKFFVHGVDYSTQLANFNAFSLIDSDAVLSTSYVERPESKYHFFRPQGLILDIDTGNIYGASAIDAGSDCEKELKDFKLKNYIDRSFIAGIIKDATGMNDDEYIKFVEINKNKPMSEIQPEQLREKIIKAFAGMNTFSYDVNKSYNEIYISNPVISGVFAYATNGREAGNPIKFISDEFDDRLDFLVEYAIKKDLPFIVFGE